MEDKKDFGERGKWRGEFSEQEILDSYGFIYLVRAKKSKKIYIGKKNTYSITKKNFGKKKMALVTDNRKKTYEMVRRESKWREYCSSSSSLLEDVKKLGENEFVWMIIATAGDKRMLTYLETKLLFFYEVLERESYNDNILGKFYKRKNDE